MGFKRHCLCAFWGTVLISWVNSLLFKFGRNTLPQKIINETKTYINALYGIQDTDRIFDFGSNHTLNSYLNKVCEENNIEPIRIHDLRHSHAALCIEMGFSIYEISKRLGHQDIKITMNTYGHLYPNKQAIIADSLDRKIDDFEVNY